MTRLVYPAIWIALVTAVLLILLPSPVLTNDGPVHISIGNLINSLSQNDRSIQNEFYSLNFALTPNLMVDWLAAALLHIFSARTTESIIQILCILGPVAAAHFMLEGARKGSGYLALLILPISFNTLFYMGLYNYCLSTMGFFLVMGCYFRLLFSPTWRASIMVALALVFTFFCHASGFIMAYLGVGAMTFGRIWLSAFADDDADPASSSEATSAWRKLVSATLAEKYVIASLILPLPLALTFLSGSGGPIAFGPSLERRIYEVGTFINLKSNAMFERIIGVTYGFGMWFLFAAVLFWGLRRSGLSLRAESRTRLAGLGGFVTAMVVVGFFPDKMGGGWTHFDRFMVYPYFWIVILFALFGLPQRVGTKVAAVTAVMSAALLVSMQNMNTMANGQLEPMAEMNEIIGAECTVLPIMLETKPVESGRYVEGLRYHPYLHAAQRLELEQSRVVLYNYLLRLQVYPVTFQENAEPQRHLFKWADYQEDSVLEQLDIEGYEDVSGHAIDYVLVWGLTDDQLERHRDIVASAVDGAQRVYQSPDGKSLLYRRVSLAPSSCSN